MSDASGRRRLVILGAGGYAEEVADLASEHDRYEIVAFIEGRRREACGTSVHGVPVLWIDDIPSLPENCVAVCAVGSPARSAFIAEASARGLRFGTFVHPSAHVSRSARLGAGCIVGPHVVVAAHTTIGEHVILNRGVLVGHHASIGDCVTLSPGANVAGRTRIGEGAFIGMGAVILDGLTVGEGAVVGSGAVVTRDVPARVQVLGVPARSVRTLEEVER